MARENRNNTNQLSRKSKFYKSETDPLAIQMVKDQFIEKNNLIDAAELYLCSSEAYEREQELTIRNAIDAANAKRKTPKAKAVVELNPNWSPQKNKGGRFAHKFRKQIKET